MELVTNIAELKTVLPDIVDHIFIGQGEQARETIKNALKQKKRKTINISNKKL